MFLIFLLHGEMYKEKYRIIDITIKYNEYYKIY